MSITEKDFILRMINQIAETLARISGLRAGGQTEEAVLLVQESVDGILGGMGRTIEQVDAGSAAMLLDSPDRVRAYGLLVAERAAVRRELGDVQRGQADRVRALELLSAWMQKTGGMDDDVRRAIEGLQAG